MGIKITLTDKQVMSIGLQLFEKQAKGGVVIDLDDDTPKRRRYRRRYYVRKHTRTRNGRTQVVKGTWRRTKIRKAA